MLAYCVVTAKLVVPNAVPSKPSKDVSFAAVASVPTPFCRFPLIVFDLGLVSPVLITSSMKAPEPTKLALNASEVVPS